MTDNTTLSAVPTKPSKPSYGYQCKERVDAGASRVRGWHNLRNCHMNPCGEHGYCAVHARMHGLEAPAPAAKPACYVVEVREESSGRVYEMYFDAKSERGLRQAMTKRNKRTGDPITLVRIVRVIP
jgi:hypothetical protein